jgi:hypothetical protein
LQSPQVCGKWENFFEAHFGHETGRKDAFTGQPIVEFPVQQQHRKIKHVSQIVRKVIMYPEPMLQSGGSTGMAKDVTQLVLIGEIDVGGFWGFIKYVVRANI